MFTLKLKLAVCLLAIQPPTLASILAQTPSSDAAKSDVTGTTASVVPEQKFVTLFDGESLAGWRPHLTVPKRTSVANGWFGTVC